MIYKIVKIGTLFTLCFCLFRCGEIHNAGDKVYQGYEEARNNSVSVNEALARSQNYMNAWLLHADPETGLIPRNLDGGKGNDLWNARDCAADNYPFLVLTSFFTDREKYNGIMLDILESEKLYTSRVGALPDTYSFSKRGFEHDEISMDRIVFGTSEYIKDGLLPLIEWLGESPWSDRMMSMLMDLDEHIDVAGGLDDKSFGNSPQPEVNGELLQILSRVYWETGDERYLEWACKIGDYYLLGENYPLTGLDYLRLRDHGCELVAGLCELYTSLHYADPEKKEEYQPSLHRLLDYILKYGRNPDGLFYNAINPQTGQVIDSAIADTWGYTLNGYLSVYQIDSVPMYKKAVETIFSNLHKYKNYNWERNGADGYADAIEGCINIMNRIPDPNASDWVESEIKVMWSLQDSSHRPEAQQWKNNGVIEGWYGDGNFARTSIMYALWKTGGCYALPWDENLNFGAKQMNDSLLVTINSKDEWQGKLHFDKKRHSVQMKLPVDWPRINQFPEWFTVDPEKQYKISMGDSVKTYSGRDLINGIEISVGPQKSVQLIISFST